MSEPDPSPPSDQDLARLQTALTGWLSAHDPQTTALLDRHPHRAAILTRAATALLDALQEAEEIQADPERMEGDLAAFYLQPHPRGLETVLVENMASDRDFWRFQMRNAPELMDSSPETPETVP